MARSGISREPFSYSSGRQSVHHWPDARGRWRLDCSMNVTLERAEQTPGGFGARALRAALASSPLSGRAGWRSR